jgi:uncharacterized membrane protein
VGAARHDGAVIERGHSHGHGAGADVIVAPRIRRLLYVIAAGVAVLTVIGMFALRPTGEDRPDLTTVGLGGALFDATLLSLDEQPCPGGPEGPDVAGGPDAAGEDQDIRCALARFELVEGPDAGLVVQQELFDLDSLAPVSPGDTVVLRLDEGAGEEFRYRYTGDPNRKGTLLVLALLFAVTVVVLGRFRGLAALGGLAASLFVLIGFMIPAIVDGRSPLLVAVVGAAAIAYVALYLAHGLGPMTTVALLGTLAALVLTLVLGAVFVELAAFSGLATEDAFFVEVGGAAIDVRGLILAGVVVGALGAIDDMTVTQASSVWELHAANPRMSARRLFRSAMTIGRDHVASTVNTLVLAYAGASMPLLVLFVLSDQSLADVANSEVVATEIVRTLVGSMGLVAAVPITTYLAALVVREGMRTRTRPPGASGDEGDEVDEALHDEQDDQA